MERLRQEVRQLKAKAKEREVQIAFAKKIGRNTQSGGGTAGRYQAIQEMN